MKSTSSNRKGAVFLLLAVDLIWKRAVFLWYAVTENRSIQRVSRLGVPFLVHASRAAIQNVVF